MIRGFIALFGLAVWLTAAPASAQDARSDAQGVVDKAVAAIEDLRASEDFPIKWEPLMANARAIMVVPEQYKAGFIIGGEYGIGVLVKKGPDGGFLGPAFYKLYTGSIGLQIGGQKARSTYFIMTDAGLDAIMSNSFKAGADVAVSVADQGGGLEASTTANLDADIYAFTQSMGLYGGGSLEGAVIKPHREYNTGYYQDFLATPETILAAGGPSNPGADPLKALLVVSP